MSERLEWTIQPQDSVTRVVFSGPINEDSDFAKLLASLTTHSQIRLDLGGISRINSCGVREWVNFVRTLPRNLTFELESCSPPIVNQLNMISNFAGSARVVSVQAPYVCPHCSHEERVLLQVESGRQPSLPAAQCPKCSSEMEFDDLEESYFAFLRRD